jgi:hypothetical protein
MYSVVFKGVDTFIFFTEAVFMFMSPAPNHDFKYFFFPLYQSFISPPISTNHYLYHQSKQRGIVSYEGLMP